MSVFKFPSQAESVLKHFEIDERTRTVTVRLNPTHAENEIFFARCREALSRLAANGECKSVVFDLSDILVLPSSAQGLIVAVSNDGVTVRVVNPSPSAREDFLITGLDRLIELDATTEPPPK